MFPKTAIGSKSSDNLIGSHFVFTRYTCQQTIHWEAQIYNARVDMFAAFNWYEIEIQFGYRLKGLGF